MDGDASADQFSGDVGLQIGESEYQIRLKRHERPEQIAGRLIAEGVKPNCLVGLFIERSLEMLVTVLAIWKAGGFNLAR